MAKTNRNIQDSWVGGIADGSKSRGKNFTYQDGIGLDYTSDIDKLTALHKLKKDSATTVTDLIMCALERKGETWFYGNTGKVYRRTSAGVWSLFTTITSSHGNGMALFNDEIWLASDSAIHKIIDLDNTRTLKLNYFKSVDTELMYDLEMPSVLNTYTPPIAMSETATNKASLLPQGGTELSGFSIDINNKGTGDWTFLLHDSLNAVLAEVVVTNAAMATGRLRVHFGKVVLTSAAQYHIHVLTSNASGSVKTYTTNDLSSADVYFYNYLNADSDTFDDNVIYGNTTGVISNVYAMAYQKYPYSEATTDKITFVATKQNISAVTLLFKNISSTLNLILHDENNNELGTAQSTVATTFQHYHHKVSFTTPIKLNLGATYHLHYWAGAGTTEVAAGTASDFSTAEYHLHYQVLSSDQQYHPMKELSNKLCIGNGRALATIDDSEIYESEALILPPDEKVRSLATVDSFIAVGAWKGTSISDYGVSRLYLWDSVATTYNYWYEVDGQINTLISDSNNKLFIIHGETARISSFTGGDTPLITSLRKLNLDRNKNIEVYPQAAAMWDGVLMFGISGGTDTGVDRLVYAYGRKDKDTPFSLSKDYPISAGDIDSGVQVGCILAISKTKFFVGWKNDSTYGVDIIDTANQQTDVWEEHLREDNDNPSYLKLSTSVALRCEPLQAGQSIEVYYRLNNYDDGTASRGYSLLGTISYTDNGAVFSTSFPFAKEWFECELLIHLKTTTATAPTLLSVEYQFNDREVFQMNNFIIET